MVVHTKVEPVYVNSTLSRNKLNYTYVCAILSAVYVSKAYLHYHLVTIY